MSSPVETRLRRLRIILTLVFAGALAIGLIILAVVAIETDSNSREQARDATMSERVEASSRLIYFSADGQLRLDGLRDDDATVGSPEIRVYRETPDGFTEIFRGRGPHLPLTDRSVDEAASRAVRTESRVRLEATDADGAGVVILATPFYEGDRPAGAVISATPADSGDDGHRNLVIAMLIGCGGLLIFATGAGWLLAGRSLRPAARGLAQQEALLADAAHELRNPIASIQSVLEAAQIDPGSREQAIRTALESTRQIGSTVESLLLRARVEAGAESIRRVPLRLDQIVTDLVAELDPDEAVRIEAGETVIEGDPVLIRIALRNLIENALRYGRGPDSKPVIEVAVEPDRVLVMDRGPGPPTGVQDGFHRFREGSPGGTGLGLSIAAWIAEEHGGSLRLENRAGGGTVASLRLGGPPA
jgi:two-component system, OmpR family, sensor kinase